MISPWETGYRPAMASHSSRWPLPAMPANAENLPALGGEAHVVQDFYALAVETGQPLDLQAVLRVLGFGAVDVQGDGVADHHVGQLLGAGLLVFTVAINWPLRRTETRSEMAMTSLSLWVMMTMDFPSARMFRSTEKSFSVSWGSARRSARPGSGCLRPGRGP